MPRFSIILPVKNGGEYVKDCVASILAQSLSDFELVVLDNKSSDGTLEWLHSVDDKRIIIYPASESLSIEDNWKRAAGIPKNEFMTLIGHDDLLAPNFLETMYELITRHPGASLYSSHFSYIDARGKLICNSKPMPELLKPDQLLGLFLKQQIDMMGTGYMMRSKDYDQVGGIPLYPNLLFADFELWIILTAKSYLAISPANCFSFRLHQSMTKASPDIKYHQAFGQFMHFLADLNKNKSLSTVINTNAAPYLLYYCRALSHRLLRTDKNVRNNLSVKDFIEQCIGYAKDLDLENDFHPDRERSIVIASMLDRCAFGRSLFLAFKKIYSKPVMK